MQSTTPQRMTRCTAGGTAFCNASTAMCTFARYTAAPPRNENITIRTTEAGSGQESGLLMA